MPCSFLNLYPPSIWAPLKVKLEANVDGDGNPGKEGLPSEEIGGVDSIRPDCVLGVDLSETSLSEEKKPMFLCKKWRNTLCKCRTCCEFYSRKGISYLIDSGDSIEEYENMAKRKRQEKMQEQEGAELNFLNTLNHVQKIEILNGIADMKNELHSFMVSLSFITLLACQQSVFSMGQSLYGIQESYDSSKPITSADVQGIFENLAKKRQRLL